MVGCLRHRICEGSRDRDDSRLKKWIGSAAFDSLGTDEEIVESSGLLGGLNAWHFRVLCDNPWNGGGGYSPREVSRWTLDQCWFRLCDRDVLGSSVGRVKNVEVGEVKIEDDGSIKGRAADGTPISGRIAGKSLARQLMEQEDEKRKQEELKRQKVKKRKRRKV